MAPPTVSTLARSFAGACALMAALAVPASAQDSPGTPDTAVGTDRTVMLVAGGVNVIIGAILCFTGIRFFRVTLPLGVAYFWYMLAYIIFVNVGNGFMTASLSNKNLEYIIQLAAAIVLGISFAFLQRRIWRWGMLLVGFLCGILMATGIQGLKSGGLIPSHGGFYGLAGGLAVFYGLFNVMAWDKLYPLIISFSGAYLVAFGINDLGNLKAFPNPDLIWYKDGAGENINPTGVYYGLLGGVVGATIVGVVIQRFLYDPALHGPASQRLTSPRYKSVLPTSRAGYAPINPDEY